MAKDERTVQVGGRKLRVTNLDKELYPSTGTTKGDVIAYYSAIAETMLPHCENRPATRKRWPDGVGEDGTQHAFFQKDIGEGAPEWVHTGKIQHKDHSNEYPLVNDEATLVWLAQLAALEIHVPQWRFDDEGNPQHPDRMVFDLDPGEGVPLTEVARIAFLVRDVLIGMGLPSIPLTSGSKGIHLYAALDGTQTSDEVVKIAHELARVLEADHPDAVTSSMKRSLRPGKVFLDWSQNSAAKTTVAPYALRGRVTPTVAAPRTWRELASPHLKHLQFDEVLKRVKKRGDPLAELLSENSAKDRQANDKLSLYRSKRDPMRTSEPVPAPGSADISTDTSDGSEADSPGAHAGLPRFVIQRHEARRLHHDFRLEHDGVLVSWALPKGPPTDHAVNHLAVPTEDHPMSYRHFEGVIPKGEYGGGTVEIWDAGHYELEKWRDDEVIATLHGRPGGGLGGTKRFALFRAGESRGKPRWMIHLMAPRSEQKGATKSAALPPVRDSPQDDYVPMLAEPGSRADFSRLDDTEWAYEMKWDGIRALAFVDGERAVLRSRSGADVTSSFPEFSELAAVVNAEAAVLDGEIVALEATGAPSFGLLQQRFGLTTATDVARAQRSAPASLLVFDVLSVNGQDCRNLSYRQRRELLRNLVEPSPAAPVAMPESFEGSASEARAASVELGLEGVMAKRWESQYRSGVRSDDWVKFPLIHTEEAVVIGWRESTADSLGLASLLLATRAADGELHYAGRVGTGFSTAERRRIRKQLDPLETTKAAIEVPAEARRDARWVRPERIGEVKSKGRTRTGSFRQPVWRGWRPDKTT